MGALHVGQNISVSGNCVESEIDVWQAVHMMERGASWLVVSSVWSISLRHTFKKKEEVGVVLAKRFVVFSCVL